MTALVLTQLGFPDIATGWGAAHGVAAQSASDQTLPLPEAGPVVVILKPQSGFRTAGVAASNDITPTAIYGDAIDGFSADLNDKQIQNLADDPDVAYVVPDIQFHAAAQSPSTAIARTGLNNSSMAQIDGVDNPVNTDIAIIDSGINPNSPDLNVVGGVNCMSGNPVGSGWADDDGHGTHVAGIAAARDNGTGVVGSAPGARLWAVKVLDSSGNGSLTTVLCGVNWVASNASTIRVANMSLTATITNSSTCTTGNDALHTAICAVAQRNVAVVVAAGNSGIDSQTVVPARYSEVISVAAVTDYDGKPGNLVKSRPSKCPNTGDGADDSLAAYSNYGSIADIAAPGSCILSDWDDGTLHYDTGTSMASPLVAGAAGLYKAQNPGASTSAVLSWLQSTASQAKSSSVGYSGNNGGRILYLGDLSASFPTGTVNPSFSGSKASVHTSWGSSNTSGSSRVTDNDSNTSWYTTNSNPTSGAFVIDLGSLRSLTGVKWQWKLPDGADRMLIQTSSDGVTWQTVGTYQDGSQMYTWYGVALGRAGQYVRVSFTNPRNRAVLGYMTEIQIFAATTTTNAGTRDPSFSGSKLAISTSWGSSNGSGSGRAWDNSTNTSWYTVNKNPTTGSFTLDLGRNRQLTGVKWQFKLPDGADSMLVETSLDGDVWQTVGLFTDKGITNTWLGIALGRSGRYVRFSFANPSHVPVLGYVTEVQIWGNAASLAATTSEPTNPSFDGSRLPIVSSWGSANGSGSGRTWDNDLNTSWYTAGATPASGAFVLDLGQVQTLTGVKWMVKQPGGTDSMLVQTSIDGVTWRSIGEYSEGSVLGTWLGVPVDMSAQYVRFNFANPNDEPVLGYITEVQVWGNASGATPANTGEADPAFDGAILP
ncbi:MAG TPA: S8 family serine peptidase, partial [Thermomicrobiales bacterium]|nr:S8 family serine peptidase [Thermomicrobiales bacterium]